MSNLTIFDMMKMQIELWEQHKETWSPMEAEYGRNFILWMMEEIGESIAIIKKKGDTAIMQDSAVRSCFIEEMSDVLMYYTDTLLRYGITAEEFSAAYKAKHEKNMGRNYQSEYNTNTQNKRHGHG